MRASWRLWINYPKFRRMSSATFSIPKFNMPLLLEFDLISCLSNSLDESPCGFSHAFKVFFGILAKDARKHPLKFVFQITSGVYSYLAAEFQNIFSCRDYFS